MTIISRSKQYDENATINHVKSLAFNRTASSVGEREAVNYIEKELVNANIKVKKEFFYWVGPNRIIIRIMYMIIISYLLLLKLYLIILLFMIVKYMSRKMRNISLVEKKESRNIYTLFRSRTKQEKEPIVIFSAHHDSILTKYAYKYQKYLNALLRIISLPFYLFILILSIWVSINLFLEIPVNEFYIILVGLSSMVGLGIIIPIFIYFFSTDQGESAGSIDNASGVAILIELAKILKKNPLENINVLLFWSGAEEWGLKGSKNFCKQYFDDLNEKYDLDNSYHINIDMVGSHIGLIHKIGLIRKEKINEDLNEIIEKIANHLNISILKYSKKFKHNSDHQVFRSFAKKYDVKLQVSCFHSENDSKYTHSLKDTPDKCSPEILNECLNISFNILKTINAKVKI